MNLVLDDTICIPVEFDNLDEFRDWTKSADYPDRGDYFYLSGDLWVDLSMETLLHNQIKSQIAAVLTMLVARLGMYFGDRMRLVNVEADISCEPDGMFVSFKSNRSGRAHWEKGEDSLEIIGTPDMVLEVVSSHSIQKDTVILRELYARAGISEYWLVNSLGERISFDVLRLSRRQYAPVRKTSGWVKSTVFGKSFRLVRQKSDDELPQYRLLVR